MMHHRVFYFISELTFELNKTKINDAHMNRHFNTTVKRELFVWNNILS